MQQTYWMVHRVSGQGSPNAKHPSLKEAVKEAKRLAFNCPGEHFTVLQVVDCYVKPSDGAQRVPLAEVADASAYGREWAPGF